MDDKNTSRLDACEIKTLTDEFMSLLSDNWNFVVNIRVTVEVKGLKCVKEKIAHVLVHVDAYDSPIEIVNNSTSVHDLNFYVSTHHTQRQQSVDPWQRKLGKEREREEQSVGKRECNKKLLLKSLFFSAMRSVSESSKLAAKHWLDIIN